MKRIIAIIIGLVIFALSIYNIATQGKDFFQVNAGTVVTASIALVASYLFSQIWTDERRKRDVIDSVIVELKVFIEDESLCLINKNTDTQMILSKIRKIRNDIDFIKQLKMKDIRKEDIEYIETNFDSYDKMIGEHLTDLDYLEKSKNTLKSYFSNINSKLNKIRSDIYHLQ